MNKKLYGRLLDLVGLCGASSVVFGVALVHPPSAYIVGGLFVVTLAILRARRWVS